MDFISILQTVKEYIPIPVIVAVIAVIMLVYGSSLFLTVLEEFMEESWGKQIKRHFPPFNKLCKGKSQRSYNAPD